MFGLGPVCFGKCPADTKPCMGILCVPNGVECSNSFQSMYSKIKTKVKGFIADDNKEIEINFGRLLDDGAPTCPSW